MAVLLSRCPRVVRGSASHQGEKVLTPQARLINAVLVSKKLSPVGIYPKIYTNTECRYFSLHEVAKKTPAPSHVSGVMPL